MKLDLPSWLWPAGGRLGLAEWLVLACIVGVLLSGVAWATQPAKLLQQSQDNQRKSDLTKLRQALQAYAEDHNGQYPIVSSGAGYYSCYNCGWEGAETESNTGQRYTSNTWIPELVENNYIASLPIDPWQGSAPGCSSSGYVYLSGGIGYKVFDWCSPRNGLVAKATDSTYCNRPPYDGSQLVLEPAGFEALPEFVDPARPGWAYAIYTHELACY